MIYNDHERIELDYSKIGAMRRLLATAEHDVGLDPKPAAKTPEQIAELKRQWLDDGCWDIEYTDGFEAHRDELIAWRAEYEAKRDAQRLAKVSQILEHRADSRWERAALACLAGGDDSQEAIARADKFIALVQGKWAP